MQKSDSNQKAKTARRKVSASTTLNRRYVRKPRKNTDMVVTVKRSPKVRHFNDSKVSASTSTVKEPEMVAAQAHPIQVAANQKISHRAKAVAQSQQVSKLSAKEIKDRAIQKALASAEKTTKNDKKTKKVKGEKIHFGFGRVVLALSCAAAAVFAIAYFVNLNMPDISLRVAAMQTGIEASYPSYVPRDFNLSDITSEEGKITLNFKNAATGDAFLLVEEQSSWDSNALLTNFVKDSYGENYTVIREQGLTLYVSGSDACWVNGGVVYKITMSSGVLTKKQIKAIATSL